MQDVVTARLEAATTAIEEAAGRFDQLIVENAADIATLSGQTDIAETGARLQEALATRTRTGLLIDLVQRNVTIENWPQVAEDPQSQTLLALEGERAAIAGERAGLPAPSAEADALGTWLEDDNDGACRRGREPSAPWGWRGERGTMRSPPAFAFANISIPFCRGSGVSRHRQELP